MSYAGGSAPARGAEWSPGDGPGGLMSTARVDAYSTTPQVARETRLAHAHPRGRGFLVVSRLAREGTPQAAPFAPDPQGDTVTSTVRLTSPTDEWRAPVLTLGRLDSAPRHRRDDEPLRLAL